MIITACAINSNVLTINLETRQSSSLDIEITIDAAEQNAESSNNRTSLISFR